jgi:hypothetical protein
MKRQNFILLIMVALVVGLLGSCDALFQNQFKAAGLGQVTGAALANSNGATLLQESGLEGAGISQSFIDAALSDPTVTQEILTTLEALAADAGSPPATVQAAEALIIEIQLVESGGKEFVDNIVTAIASIDFTTFNPFGNPNDLASLLSKLFPAKALPAGWTQADIALVINALYDLGPNFNVLVNAIGASGAYAAAGIDAGWLAQVGAVVTILHQITPLWPVGAPTIGDSLAALINSPADYATYISFDPDTIQSQITGNANLVALFTAAGLNLNDLLAQFGA